MGLLDRFRRERPERATPPSAPPPEPPRRDAFGPLRALSLDGADLDLMRPVLIDGLLQHGVSADSMPSILEHVRDGIALFELGDTTRRSRIGGAPQLPEGTDWPRDRDGEPFSFIAAIDLDEMPGLDPLPPDGTLLVYWSERYFEFERMDFLEATRVFWVAREEGLAPATAPEGAPSYESVPLSGGLMPILGGFEDVRLASDEEDAWYEAVDELTGLHQHQLLGASRDVQGPVLGEVAYWFDNGWPESREGFSDAELAGEGWMLLGQIESTGELMFGDAGALYLLILRDDLDARRFDRVLGIMQCS